MRITNLSLAVAVTFSAQAALAVPLLDATINEGAIPGTPENIFTVDKINGGFEEIIVANPDLTFTTELRADLTGFFNNDGTSSVSPTHKDFFEPTGYKLYATFSASGNIIANTDGTFDFESNNGAFQLYADLNSDTEKNAGALSPLNLGQTSDDKLLGSSSVISFSNAFYRPNSDPSGSFEIHFNEFDLTELGAQYFISPSPFYSKLIVDGDFDNFALDQTTAVTGDLSVVFVPEPATVALLSLGLLGVAARRRKA